MNLNSFADIFWLVLSQLQNRFFVDHLPMAAYVCCLKEKEWNEIESFHCTQSDILLCGSVGEIGTNSQHFSLKNEKKLRTVRLKQNLLVLIKSVHWFAILSFFSIREFCSLILFNSSDILLLHTFFHNNFENKWKCDFLW